MINNKIKNYILTSPKIFNIVSKTIKYLLKVKNLFKITKYKEIYLIDPNKINKSYWKYINIFKSNNLKINEKIKWKSLKEYSVYESFYNHFINNVKWEETTYFKENIQKIELWEKRWWCKNIKDFSNRCKNLDELYKDIKENGFIINPEKNSFWLDEICVIVWELWEYYLVNWKHRLIITQILKIDKIPVRIIWRHKKWIDIINEINKNLNWFSYQDFWHDDLDTNIIIKRDWNIRFNKIIENIPFSINKNDNILDIWWNIWSITRKFETRFWTKNYISEIEDIYVNILNILKNTFNYKYEIIHWDVMNWKSIKTKKFKLVIALSIFHHFIKTEELFKKFKTFLNSLDTEMIVFESHIFEEEQMNWSYKNFKANDFAEFIKKETWLNNIINIWESEKKWREIFIIYK